MRFIFTFIFIAALCGSEVQINEIVSSNQNTFFDEDGDTPDWIELYNSSSNDISILNWGLTDDSSELFKWRFPNTVINAGDYLLIMAFQLSDITLGVLEKVREFTMMEKEN